MLKMFSTQLAGLFGRIHDKQEENFEDGARLLAQAIAGAGRIFIFGKGEMAAVGLEAASGAEPLAGVVVWDGQEREDFSAADRALVFARYSTDPEAVHAAQVLQNNGIPFTAVSTVAEGEGDSASLVDLADVHLDLMLKRGLLPDETGGRFGFPAPIAALFVYYGLKFTIEEILADYE
ncbi:DUF2529 domain-containing protein [Bacillus sp. B-jedd]|uniref:DUF2529 domain-containing protein n=1 Tax=Bacillus sp. B-jedd TaxID=1476857 RepID=UPI0005155D6C|nr:DUF2529 domain-containing protein [Bacillus sp. B-jedd]CEG29214.1 Hypothetical protein BN1002_04146 [Bacillus sp. B-jedd]